MSARITKAAARRLGLKAGGRNKYRAVRTTVDGLTFDSKAEAAAFSALLLEERAGFIRNLRRQVAYPLMVNDMKVATYRADYVYERLDRTGKKPVWRLEVADKKGVATPAYKLKRRLMEACYGIVVKEL